MPIVGILSLFVIFFANDVSIHSKTIEKTPASSKSLASFKILFLSKDFFPLNLKFYKYLKKNKIKICIVSPELVSKKFSYKSKKLKEYILKKGFKIDAVCTKLPAIWKVN